MNNRTISSLLIVLAYALALVLTLIACGAQHAASEIKLPAASQPYGSTSLPAAPADQPQDVGTEAAEAYRKALEGIYTDHLYPNGDPVDVPEWAEMENNLFAICDVDGDGSDELIYKNESSSMTGMTASIYSFDSYTGELYLELSGFVAMTFYDNGVIRVEASHNQGLSARDDFWPYALYQYDTSGDGYLMLGYVDAWDKETFPADFDGSLFPDDIDQDGDGLVYLLTFGGQEVTDTTLDGPDYQRWLNACIDGAAELDLPWQAMTRENIQAVTSLSFPF